MEEWAFEFEWLKVRHTVKALFNKKDLPDLNAILFLIGIQELGFVKKAFTKEEKQDLMHLAVCTLLSQDGYYEFKGRDQDNWPHFEKSRLLKLEGVEAQEHYLKTKVIEYFNLLEEEE